MGTYGSHSSYTDDPPPVYLSLLDSLDPSPSGVIPLSAVHRLLATSRLPASTVEHIITLTARDASSLSRSEFFCALALVSLAQSTGETEITLEQLSESLPNLPLPTLTAVQSPRAYVAPDTPSASPWDTAPRVNGNGVKHDYLDAGDTSAPPSGFTDAPTGAFDVEAERGYWKKLEKVDVSLVTQKEGWFLQKYTVESDVSCKSRGWPS